ncbi:hypothetical protein BX667DRAFT_501227 [Coemansia mojavensis]|nr:hypothetical protein BX667DRAFT_501227 [Coemansia mojavensis]
MRFLVWLSLAIALLASTVLAEESSASETVSPAASPSPYPQYMTSDPPILGEVVYNFVIGMLTIVNNAIRGYLLLPPL